MSETTQGNNDSRSFGPLIGFTIGALVGGALALMFAPASGEKTRQRIGEAARRLSRETRHTLEGMGEAATGLGGDVKAAVTAGRAAFRHDGEAQEETTPPRTAPRMASPPRPL